MTASHVDYPFARQSIFDPPREYEDLRAAGGLANTEVLGRPTVLATRYADVREACLAKELSADPRNPRFPSIHAGRGESDHEETTFVHMDPPEHTKHRALIAKWFRVARVNELRVPLQRQVEKFLDELEAGPRPVDLLNEFALKIPTWVICELLGVPYSDHEFFQTLSVGRLSRNAGEQEMHEVTTQLNSYLGRIVDDKIANPTDDILGDLAIRAVHTGQLTRDELVRMARLLLVAGHETTANVITLSVALLLHRHDQLDLLLADPSRWPDAVEELLRYLTPSQFLVRRLALADVEIGGTLVPAGVGVHALLNSANRDERRFERPDELNVLRDARGHLAFGFGIHQCLGQTYARVEIEIALRSLFGRLPGLRLAVPVTELRPKVDSSVHGLHELPVTW